MSNLLDEKVPRVAPLSMRMIEELGRCFLAQLAPESLSAPGPLNVCALIDMKLAKFGIHVSPASEFELGNREAATTFHEGTDEIEILVSESVWENVREESPVAYYPRSTICHEIGHALIHIPHLRHKIQMAEQSLSRMRRKELKPYEDPEWQAFAFAGAILMPSLTLKKLSKAEVLSPELVSRVYRVSEPMAASHLKRLKWLQS